jgi:hypothetical protein
MKTTYTSITGKKVTFAAWKSAALAECAKVAVTPTKWELSDGFRNHESPEHFAASLASFI